MKLKIEAWIRKNRGDGYTKSLYEDEVSKSSQDIIIKQILFSLFFISPINKYNNILLKNYPNNSLHKKKKINKPTK